MNSTMRGSLRWTLVVSALLLSALGALCFLVAPPAAVCSTAATFLLFMLPGISIGPALFGKTAPWLPERVVFGAVFGIAASGYIAIVVGFIFGWSPKLILLSILGLSCVCAAVGYILRDRPLLPLPREWTQADYQCLAAMGLVVVVFVALPYLHVGKLTSHGYAYTWLFGIDFLWRSDVIAAMTLHLPPDLLWMTGVPVRMYLVGYALPAFAWAAGGKAFPLHSVLLLATLGLGLLLTATLYTLLRIFFAAMRVLLSVAFIALLAYSYYWLYDVAKWIANKPRGESAFWTDPRFWNYDGVSHLFQRSFLVEPQAALATSLLLLMLAALSLVQYRLNRVAMGTALGVCLGLCFGTDAMEGLVIIVWFGLLYSARFAFSKGPSRSELVPFLSAIASCMAIAGSFFLLGMYKPSTSHLVKLHFNSWIALFGIAFFPVEFGPLILLGACGVIRWWRHGREAFAWPLLLLAAVVLIQLAFVSEPPVPTTRMADRLLPVVFLVFAGCLFEYLWSRRAKVSERVLAGVLVFAALPTFFTDIYVTSNLDGYNTRYVRAEDKKACDWIRDHLPETTVVQGETQYFSGEDRGRYLNLIASFSQRPQVLGWYSGAAVLVDEGPRICLERIPDIRAMLAATDVSQVAAIAKKYSIQYLYVGPFEQQQDKGFLALIQSAPERFREVYSQEDVHIFRCSSAGAGIAESGPAVTR